MMEDVKPTIVLVEDDSVILELIQYNLLSDGYKVETFMNGLDMLEVVESIDNITVFILDLMLPGIDGLEICRRLREKTAFKLVPVMILTAKSTESDKVLGLEAGADDYMTKPFGIREFLARVQAHTRRYRQALQENYSLSSASLGESFSLSFAKNQEEIIKSSLETKEKALSINGFGCKYKNLFLDDTKHRVFLDEEEVEMTNREYELLKFLMQHRGIAYSRDDLLNYVWGYEYSGETRTVDVHIRQLRRKLEKDDKNPVFIETIRGRGYRFSDKI